MMPVKLHYTVVTVYCKWLQRWRGQQHHRTVATLVLWQVDKNLQNTRGQTDASARKFTQVGASESVTTSGRQPQQSHQMTLQRTLSYCMKKSWWDESGGVSFSNRFASSCILCFILRISADSLWLYKRHTYNPIMNARKYAAK